MPSSEGQATTATHDWAETNAKYEQVQALARLLDEQFRVPGTRFRFGVDALLGLIPVIGGAAGLTLSAGLVLQAIRLGARGATVARMVLYVTLDATIGTIPVIGSVFDFFFKANMRAIGLMERHSLDPVTTQARSAAVIRRTAIGAAIGIVLAAALMAVTMVALLMWMF